MEKGNVDIKQVPPTLGERISRFRTALSHVGLLFALVLYTAAGGLVFRELERPGEVARVATAQHTLWKERRRFIQAIVNSSADTRNLGVLLGTELSNYEAAIYEAASTGVTVVPAFDQGVTGASFVASTARWSYLQSIFFASTVLTTIGYGNVAPVTISGRAFCVVFALIGIPLTLTVIADMGKLLASGLSALNARLRQLMPCASSWTLLQVQQDEGGGSKKRGASRTVRSLLTALSAIALLLLYIAAGAVLFTFWEDWTFFEGFYFCFITMTTIGFGDLVPQEPEYMLICTLYILVGLALTSTIIELVRRQYAQSWRRMKELSARLQGLSGPLSEALRRIDLQGKASSVDLGVLQELRDLKKTLALTRLETRLRFSRPSGVTSDNPEWARQMEEVLKDIVEVEVEDVPRKPVLQIIVYESSV